MHDYPRRGDIFWIKLDPTIGTETQKTRPCLILSNNSQNKKGYRVIAAPITSKIKHVYPFEATFTLKGRDCKVLLDQIRALDKKRVGQKISSINHLTMIQVEQALMVALALKKD